MTVTITGPSVDIEFDGTGTLSTLTATDVGLAVWITYGGGGARIVQVPDAAIIGVTWSDGRDRTSTASLIVDRLYQFDDDPVDWLATKFLRIERELQIIHDGRVVFWGPIMSVKRKPGEAALTVDASGCDYYLGCRLVEADEPIWSREWLANPNFEDGLDGWTAVMGPTVDPTGDEDGGPSVELGTGQLSQSVFFSLGPEWVVLVRARALVDAAVPDDEVLMTLECESLDFNVRRQVTAGEVTRDQWTWITAQVTMRGSGTPGKFLELTLAGDGTAAGEVEIGYVTMQVSAESLGIPGQPPRARYLTQRLAFQSVINTSMAGFGIVPSATLEGRVINAPWAERGDVFASEAVRQLVDAEDGIEWGMVLTPAQRIALMTDLWGVEHNPVTLTLTAQGTDKNVTVVSDWTSGSERPVSQWIVMDEDGFTGTYTDETLWSSLPPLQDLVQAPTGTAVSELEQRAAKLAREASPALTDELALDVDIDLASTLGWGDRVQLVVDDGPDQFDDLVRVESRVVDPLAAVFRVQVSKWEAP